MNLKPAAPVASSPAPPQEFVTKRVAQEGRFTTHDGVELFYRYWPSIPARPKGAVLLFHRGHEHSGRMAHLVDELDLPDFAFFAWDARGHGRSPGERGYSPSIAASVRDVQDFVDHIGASFGMRSENMAVIAQSVGAVLIAAWAHDYAPKIRCMVLASPAFQVKLYLRADHVEAEAILAPVLTTYQHHFIDLPTGLLLGLFCLWLWPNEVESPLSHFGVASDPRRLRLALRYALGAIALGVFATWMGGVALLLFWPAVALVMVAVNYAFFGAEGFQKSADGRMSAASRLLLAPYHAGAWINSRAWTRSHKASVAVADGVALGRIPSRHESASHITIDLCAELPGRGLRCYAFPMLDLVAPDPERLLAASRAIEAARSEGPVLVYCALGVSRSASAVATWLAVTGRAASDDDAIAKVRTVHPRIVLGEDAKRAIAAAVEQAR